MKNAGYSGTPLAKKLGIREGFKVSLVHIPDHYYDLFAGFPDVSLVTGPAHTKLDFIHYFATEEKKLAADLDQLKQALAPNGMIWISWPKKSSKVKTDITEDVIRRLALKNGLVDIKVCAVDETWSGLKLVIPVKDRKEHH
jgi:hypothetical protein